MALAEEQGRRRAALVTGASSGIGEAFAHAFARDGFDVVLVARREGPLRRVASEISQRLGVSAHVVCADLANPKAPDEILDRIEREGLEIDALVNNAGFGVPGLLSEVEWHRHAECIEVMARAPVRLAYLLAPGMAARRRGWIVNVSSLSAFVPPHAGGTLYYPLKAFMLQFSLAHRAEVISDGVHVTAVCPGFTHTGFQNAAGGTVESVSIPKFLWLKPERVARAGLTAVMRGDAICIPGRIDRIIALFFKLMPGALGRWIVRGKS